MTIGEKIKYYRAHRGYTQGQLAMLSGIHHVAIRKYETNVNEPQPAQIEKMAEALDISPFALSDIDYRMKLEDSSDITGLILQLCKHDIMVFEGDRLEDGSLDPKTAHLLFNEYFMGVLAASSFGGGVIDEFAFPPFQKNEINATKLRYRPLSTKMEDDLLRWEKANYLYKRAKAQHARTDTPESLAEVESCLDQRDTIELSFYLETYHVG